MAENETQQESPVIVLSVNKLMNLFRDSLHAVVSELENAQIFWQSFEEYDEIDSISESLFNLIVTYKLEHFVTEKYSKKANLAKYGFFIKEYKNHDCIELDSTSENERYVFVMLSSKEDAFDSILCNKVNKEGIVIERDIHFDFEEANFYFKFKG